MESKEACAQHSLTNEEALFWTFKRENGKCALRKSNAGRTKDNRFVSGNRECGEGEQVLNTRINHHLAIVLLGVNDLEQHLQPRRRKRAASRRQQKQGENNIKQQTTGTSSWKQ